MKTPLLIISDAPSASSGLGRICRDLALGVYHNLSDIYDVGTLGYGGNGDRALPFPQYNIEGMKDWFIPTIKDVWENFAGSRKGIVMTIWDASRLLWLSRPQEKIWRRDREIAEWLMTKPFKLCGYFPMDAEGPNGMLCRINAECVYGFDRVIAYSGWAKKMMENTFNEIDCARQELTAIPHGIHTNVFHPHQERDKRGVFHGDLLYNGPVLEDYEKIVGIVATNQARKDYGLAFAALAELSKDTPIRIFVNIDILERHWSIPQLLYDYNLMPRTIINMNLVPDETLARVYSACDLTLGIGPEGFGYPIFESLACGTPVLAGSVGGHAEHMEPSHLIHPVATRVEGVYNSVRPVYDPKKWAFAIKKMLNRSESNPARFTLQKSLLPPRLDWKNLWAAEWEPWFRRQADSLAQQRGPALVETSSNSEMDTDPVENRRSTTVYPVTT